MVIECKKCNATYEIELLETKANCSYTCMFCQTKFFESEKIFQPVKITNFPPKGIAVPGMVRTAIGSYMDSFKNNLDSYQLFLAPYDEPTQDWTELHLRCEKQDDDFEKTGNIVLMAIFNHPENRILIPNILVSGIFRHKGIGKKLISLILNTCVLVGYRLFLVQVVESFYERLIKRGATGIDFETVEITKDTNLT